MNAIGSATFSIASGQTVSIAVKLNAAGRGLLRAGHGRLGARLLIVKSSPTPTSMYSAKVHLLRRKHRKSGASSGSKKS